MNSLEDYIKQNRAAFDTQEPPEGHMDRFLNRLPKQKNKTILYLRTIAAAAVVTLLVTLSGLYVYDNWIDSQKSVLPTLADAGMEYAEAEAYFISTINHHEQMINQLSEGDLQQERELFKQEMKVMDSLYVQLQHDLQTNPDDPRVINAMINHYQIRIKVMQRIVVQLKDARKLKTHKTQENEKIYV